MEDRDFATIWTVFPAAEDCATAPTIGENRGSPRRPSASQRYTVDNPTPADLAAASRDPPRASSATTARAAGVVNFDGRPPGLRRTAMIEPPNLSAPSVFSSFINGRTAPVFIIGGEQTERKRYYRTGAPLACRFMVTGRRLRRSSTTSSRIRATEAACRLMP